MSYDLNTIEDWNILKKINKIFKLINKILNKCQKLFYGLLGYQIR